MCDVCGCGDPQKVSIDVHRSLLASNDEQASHLRQHFVGAEVTAINLMGSPGAGKTQLLEATAKAFARSMRLSAVSGDLATSLDAERLMRARIEAASITTGTACHLDAQMVHNALHHEPLASAVKASDFFFIENVGNLVCPAIYDLGQKANVVVLSVTEGVDKPLKYPVMFERADLVVVTKVDLLPHLPGVDLDVIRDALAKVMPNPRMLVLSALTGEGMAAFVQWLCAQRAAVRGTAPSAHTGPAT